MSSLLLLETRLSFLSQHIQEKICDCVFVCCRSSSCWAWRCWGCRRWPRSSSRSRTTSNSSASTPPTMSAWNSSSYSMQVNVKKWRTGTSSQIVLQMMKYHEGSQQLNAPCAQFQIIFWNLSFSRRGAESKQQAARARVQWAGKAIIFKNEQIIRKFGPKLSKLLIVVAGSPDPAWILPDMLPQCPRK